MDDRADTIRFLSVAALAYRVGFGCGWSILPQGVGCFGVAPGEQSVVAWVESAGGGKRAIRCFALGDHRSLLIPSLERPFDPKMLTSVLASDDDAITEIIDDGLLIEAIWSNTNEFELWKFGGSN